MTKGQFALLTAALGLATMAGAGYVGYAHADAHGSTGSGSSGTNVAGGAQGGATGPAAGQTGDPAGGSTAAAGMPGSSPTPSAGSGGSSATGSGTPSTSAPDCTNAGLQVSEAPGGAGAGHQSVLVEFTNVGSSPCSLHGYPGAAILGQDGLLLENATRTLVGPSGGATGLSSPPRILLQPNGTAAAIVEWSDVPTGSGACESPLSLGVTPPNTKQTTTFELSGQPDVCSGFEVHPVLASGSADNG